MGAEIDAKIVVKIDIKEDVTRTTKLGLVFAAFLAHFATSRQCAQLRIRVPNPSSCPSVPASK